MDIIALINTLVSGLLNAEEEFLEHLDSFTTFEETVSSLSNQMAADFIGLALTNADQLIRDSGMRKGGYTVQRRRQRTLISIVGDITFTHTLYKDQTGKSRCLLDELMRLPDRERFTAAAEAKLLTFRNQLTAVFGYGTNTAKAITKKAKPKYREIISELPEFEKGDRFKMNLVNCAMIGAFILSMPERPDVERLTEYYAKSMMTKPMKWFCRKSGKNKFTPKDISGMKATATLKAADRNPYSWNM